MIGFALRWRDGNASLSPRWSVDRLGRSLQDLVGFLGELHAKKVDLYLHQQGVDTSTPAGKALFQMMGVFAEFERAIIVERINAGLARAKANGVVLGRPNMQAQNVQFDVSFLVQDRAHVHEVQAVRHITLDGAHVGSP
jgi:DNA invertase Pin-like site-specific DNA recombinase